MTQPTPPILSPQQLQELAAARIASKRIRRAISVAKFDGWTIAIFAGLSLICGISSPSGVIMGLAMAIVAYIELNGASRLARLDPTVTRRMGINQIVFASLLVLYLAWSLHGNLKEDPTSSLSEMGVSSAEIPKSTIDLVRHLVVGIYLVLIGVVACAQGATAYYYFGRRKYIEEYLRNTPVWIIQMQKAGLWS